MTALQPRTGYADHPASSDSVGGETSRRPNPSASATSSSEYSAAQMTGKSARSVSPRSRPRRNARTRREPIGSKFPSARSSSVDSRDCEKLLQALVDPPKSASLLAYQQPASSRVQFRQMTKRSGEHEAQAGWRRNARCTCQIAGFLPRSEQFGQPNISGRGLPVSASTRPSTMSPPRIASGEIRLGAGMRRPRCAGAASAVAHQCGSDQRGFPDPLGPRHEEKRRARARIDRKLLRRLSTPVASRFRSKISECSNSTLRAPGIRAPVPDRGLSVPPSG